MKQAERAGLHRWTRREYEQLIDHGLLDEDDPVELLDGLLLVKEPQHSRLRLDPQQLRRGLAEHRPALGVGEARRLQYVVH